MLTNQEYTVSFKLQVTQQIQTQGKHTKRIVQTIWHCCWQVLATVSCKELKLKLSWTRHFLLLEEFACVVITSSFLNWYLDCSDDGEVVRTLGWLILEDSMAQEVASLCNIAILEVCLQCAVWLQFCVFELPIIMFLVFKRNTIFRVLCFMSTQLLHWMCNLSVPKLFLATFADDRQVC